MTIKKINPSIFPNIVFGIYLLISIIQYIVGSTIFRERYIVISYSLLLILFFKKIPSGIRKYIVFFIVIIVGGSILSFTNQGYHSFLYLVYSLINISLVILLFKNRISEFIPLVIFYLFSIYVFYKSTVLININDIFPETSRNSISWIGIVLCSLYYLLSILNEKKLKGPFPVIILVFICVLAEGRSGIITSILFLLCYFLFNYTAKSKIWYQILKNIILISVVVFFILNYANTLNHKLDYFYNAKYTKTDRTILIKEYLGSLDLINLFTGVNLNTISIFKKHDSNSHNSYISCHIKFGFMAIFLIVFFIYTFFRGLKKKKLYFLLSIYGCILLRITTDRLVFVENFDFLLYFTCILIHTKLHTSYSPI